MPKDEITYGEQQDAISDPGETLNATNVLNGIEAAKRVGVSVEDALESVGFWNLTDLEAAFVQRQLRERGMPLPTSLMDENVLDVALEKRRVARASAPRTEAAPPQEKTLAERVQGFATVVQAAYDRAVDREESFSVQTYIDRYRTQLGDEGVIMLQAELARRGVKDREEGGEEALTGSGDEIKGEPPDAIDERRLKGKPIFKRLEIKGGRIVEIAREEGDEENEFSRRPFPPFDVLPDWFSEIQNDPAKVEQFLEAYAELYRSTRNIKINTLPYRRGKGLITGFEAEFSDLKDERGRRVRGELESDPDLAGWIGKVNAQEASGETWYDAPGYPEWRNKQRDLVRSVEVAKRLEQLRKQLAPETKPEPLAEQLRPEDAGLTAEQGRRLKEMVREAMVKAYAEALMKKYPKMDRAHATTTAGMILDDTAVEQKYQERLAKLKASK